MSEKSARKAGTLSGILKFLLPWYLVWAYRLAPCRVRGSRCWPGSRGPSSSHIAVDLMVLGVSGWLAIFTALAKNGHDIAPKLPHWDK